jgi:hypothetical protein
MPQMGYEPMIPVFERVKTVHALDRAATVIGFDFLCNREETLHLNRFELNSVQHVLFVVTLPTLSIVQIVWH